MADIVVMNLQGQPVQMLKTELYRGSQTLDVDISRLASGTYYLLLKNADEVLTKKFVKAGF